MLQRAGRPDVKNSACIGRFHLYAHQQKCHILYNPMHTAGYDLMVGEEVEHLWWAMRHLVPTNRVSTGPRRGQKLNAFMLFEQRRMRETFGLNVCRRVEKAWEVASAATEVLKGILGQQLPSINGMRRKITDAYLREQSRYRVEYYKIMSST